MVWMTSSSCKGTTPPVHDARDDAPGDDWSAGAGAAGNWDVGDAAEGRAAGNAGTATARSLGGSDQLQKFLRVVEPMLEFRAEGLGGELGGHGIFARGGIGGDELDFIDADGGILVIAERFLDLFGEVLRFGATHGKGPDQAREIVNRDFVRKQDAGEAGGPQQLREAALGLSGFERNAIEQKFVVRHAEQETSVTAFRHGLLEFVPGGLELGLGALVGHAIQPGVLDQNIKAVEERPSGLIAAGFGLSGGSDGSLLSDIGCVSNKIKREGDLMHDYGGN